MKLSYLLDGIELKSLSNHLAPDVNIQGISDNSQNINEGDLFVAVEGFEKDGHQYIDSALKKGAIKQAIEDSQSGDWVVITGKGHEKYQQNFHLPTDSDRETVNFITKLNEKKLTRSNYEKISCCFNNSSYDPYTIRIYRFQ